MKKIIVNENGFSRLIREARMDGFRVDTLKSLPSYSQKVNYCKQMLGNPIGNGSSRMVFQLDDETVLKLAKNNKGIAQNEREYNLYACGASEFLPYLMNGTDEEDFLWIVSEYVLPAKAEDFKKVLGVPFKDIQRLVFANIYHNSKVASQIFSKYEDNYDAIDVFSSIEDLGHSYNVNFLDMSRISNWGMVMRDGKPMMVILDSGLTDEIYDKFYKPSR